MNHLPKLLIYGTGGHAKVVCEAACPVYELCAFFDDNSDAAQSSFNGVAVYQYDSNLHQEAHCVIAIGNQQVRKKLSSAIQHKFATIIAPSAIVSPSAFIAEGSMVMQGSVIQSDARIGAHCIINTAAVVDHDCEVAAFVHVAPNATLCGGVKIGMGSLIGAGSVVLPGVEIGSNVLIGAGSVVSEDVPEDCIYGNPVQKIIRKNG